MSETQTKLAYGDAVADWFIELGEARAASGDLEAGLQYFQVAGMVLCRQSRTLASPRLEAGLRFVAGKLPVPCRPQPPTGPKPVCLHVIDEALAAGGLTAMAVNWIRSDTSRTHSVALLSQAVPVPESLQQAVEASGGTLHKANPNDSFVTRAAWLRELAYSSANLAVLHISVVDVIAGAAFGIDGGPPLLMVNHAAHIFWTSACIPDVVANCRGSVLETLWTNSYRDLPSATVPIPLVDVYGSTGAGEVLALKKKLGGAENATVILTVGAFFKYSPVGDADFLTALENVLQQVPEAVLLVAGFRGDRRWKQAAERVGWRIHDLGVLPRAELAQVYAAADLYVEGFPFGSTTALLEACLHGLPVVLPPADYPPPSTSDGIALDAILTRAQTVEAYQAEIIGLCGNPNERRARGAEIRASVKHHHTSDGWREHLETAVAKLPKVHAVRTKITPVRTPEAIHERWAAFMETTGSPFAETLEHSVSRSLYMGLRPRVTEAARRACREHPKLRAGRTIPAPLLALLCNHLLPALPLGWAQKTFRAAAFLFRGSLLSKLRRVGNGNKPRSWYEDYRKAGA